MEQAQEKPVTSMVLREIDAHATALLKIRATQLGYGRRETLVRLIVQQAASLSEQQLRDFLSFGKLPQNSSKPP